MTDPYCVAMVLCDAAHRDPATGKVTLLGTFSNVFAAAFPAKIRLCVYCAITDGFGPTTIRLQIVDAKAPTVDATHEGEDPNRVFLIKSELDIESPLAVIETALGIETVLPSPGVYHCELWAGNSVLMARRLTAVLATQDEG